jgi:hypothetical protein
VLVEASILIDAPRDDVYDILTEYGEPVRLRINPSLKAQRVLERQGNVVLCENEWERDGRRIVQRRRYILHPPERIEEEVVGADSGLVRVMTTLVPEGGQTRLTIVSDYQFRGLWRLIAGLLRSKLREADDELLATLKEGIEAEFEEIPEDE